MGHSYICGVQYVQKNSMNYGNKVFIMHFPRRKSTRVPKVPGVKPLQNSQAQF